MNSQHDNLSRGSPRLITSDRQILYPQKAINDIKTFSAADRSEWLDIKKNDTNYANKRKAGVEGYKAMKKKQKQRND